MPKALRSCAAVGGMVLSGGIDFPSGATIVLVLAVVYLLTTLARPRRPSPVSK